MSKPETSIVLKEDGIYEMVLRFSKENMQNLVQDSYNYRNSLASCVTEEFAKEYARQNFSELAKLIDLETVKLLATRKLAGVVARGD